MPAYYPVYLNLNSRRCVIIGGGHEAERKAHELVECGASVTVISPEVSDGLKALAAQGAVDWVQKAYEPGDLEGVFLAIAENDKPDVYKEVAWEAQRRGILLNVVDVTNLCTFIAPAVVKRGEVTVAISTGGLSPALARRLREEIQESPALLWADMAVMLGEVRQDLRGKGIKPNPTWWQHCMDEELLALYHSGQMQEAKERLRRMLEQAPEPVQEKA